MLRVIFSSLQALVKSRSWPIRVLRILLLTVAGWAGLQLYHGFAVAAQSLDSEWPRTDFSRKTIDLGEVQSGGPPKDGIPAIDDPRLVSIAAADGWLDAREPVIVVTRNSKARAYPLQILIYHEIVNDVFEGQPIAVTFCPLCNASIVFDRHIDDRVLDFGTTGKLRRSDLVMYDRQTESWWQQFTGKAIVGRYAGTVLQRVPSQIVAYEDFRTSYRDGEVLSRRTGYSRPYGRNPYRGYDRIGDRPFLFNDPVDKRLPAMERVLSISHAGRHRIYPFSDLKGEGVVNDEIAGLPVAVFYKRNALSVLDQAEIKDSRLVYSVTAFHRRLKNRVLHFEPTKHGFIDTATRSRWNLLGRAEAGPLKGEQLQTVDSGVHFAFAWLAFNPDSEIYRSPEK